MDIYKSRWKNALKRAAKINRYLKKGYYVTYLGLHMEPTKSGFSLEGTQLIFQDYTNSYAIWFDNNENESVGYWNSVEEYNESFDKEIKVFEPLKRVAL